MPVDLGVDVEAALSGAQSERAGSTSRSRRSGRRGSPLRPGGPRRRPTHRPRPGRSRSVAVERVDVPGVPVGWGGRGAAGGGCPTAPGAMTSRSAIRSTQRRRSARGDRSMTRIRPLSRTTVAPAGSTETVSAGCSRVAGGPRSERGHGPSSGCGVGVEARSAASPGPASAWSRGADHGLQLGLGDPGVRLPRASRCTQAIDVPGRMSWNWCRSTSFQSRSSSSYG